VDALRSNALTASRLSCARTCQRKYYFEYQLGVRPVGRSRALAFGTAIHEGLAAWWYFYLADENERIERMLAAFRVSAIQEELDPFDAAMGEELLIGYHFRWKDEPWETVAVEVEFDIHLRNPTTGYPSRTFKQRGKVDVVAKHLPSGRIKVVEHKTAASDISAGSDYWKRLTLDGQVTLYVDGARSLDPSFIDIDTVTYDVIKKPSLMPAKATPVEERKYTQKASKLGDGTVRPTGSLYAGQREEDETVGEFRSRIAMAIAENPDGMYRRGDVTRLEEDLDEFRFDIWQIAEQIRESHNVGRYPRNFDACWRYGICPYFPVCTNETSIEDPTLYRKLETVHPELGS
jgi:hypothetical protein